MAKQQEFDYASARKELHELLEWFESGASDLDKALDNYKRAEELINKIEGYLDDLEKKLQITVHKSDA